MTIAQWLLPLHFPPHDCSHCYCCRCSHKGLTVHVRARYCFLPVHRRADRVIRVCQCGNVQSNVSIGTCCCSRCLCSCECFGSIGHHNCHNTQTMRYREECAEGTDRTPQLEHVQGQDPSAHQPTYSHTQADIRTRAHTCTQAHTQALTRITLTRTIATTRCSGRSNRLSDYWRIQSGRTRVIGERRYVAAAS